MMGLKLTLMPELEVLVAAQYAKLSRVCMACGDDSVRKAKDMARARATD